MTNLNICPASPKICWCSFFEQGLPILISILEYWASARRFLRYGDQCRGIISRIFAESGISPKLRVEEQGNPEPTIETLFWKNKEDMFRGLIKNSTDMARAPATPDAPDSRIALQFKTPVRLFNIKNRKHLDEGTTFSDDLKSWEVSLYRI